MEQCIRDAIFHLDCAKQALEASLTDPDVWKQESDDNTRIIARLLPAMALLSLQHPQTHTHLHKTEESSPEVPDECL
tara:strand:+ start:320 stop:550 length:231 start_codon:yes stop_codon:yes gene_type:complete